MKKYQNLSPARFTVTAIDGMLANSNNLKGKMVIIGGLKDERLNEGETEMATVVSAVVWPSGGDGGCCSGLVGLEGTQEGIGEKRAYYGL